MKTENNRERQSASSQSSPANNRVEELANALHREGRVQELERQLEELDFSLLSPAEQETWRHFYGITAFQAGRDAEALERFQEAHEKFPDSAPIRFSLGQQHIRAGEIEKGFALFRTCRFPDIPHEYAFAQARYAYLLNRYNDGLSFIRPFYDAFREVKILDDHFLYVRGLPSFGRWWDYLAAFCILSGNVGELESVTRYVSAHGYDYDFDYLQAKLEAYRDDRPERLLELLEQRQTMGPAIISTGGTRLAIAVVKARSAATLEVARETIGGVMLSAHHFTWLEDVRMLALAEAAHRLGESAAESEYVEGFLARQPMLFEPDIALNFHLLRYQERLKPSALK